MTTAPAERIGFIGLGHMGSGMTRNLLKAGFTVIVNDIRRAAAEELLANGARWASTPAEVAGVSDVVITMLPTPRHVEEVALGPQGLVHSLVNGSMWIDMSTSILGPQARARELLAGRPIDLIDAPVSGMSTGAAAGTLQIFVGGDDRAVTRARPVLEAMGDRDRILHVGGAGAGYAVKLMINQLWFSHLVATAEVLAIGVQAGVDLPVLRSALMASPANSNFLTADVLSVLERGDYDEGFAIALACKDLGLAIDLAAQVGVPADVSALVGQVYRRAKASYGDRAGEMTPIKLYEDLIGRPLRIDGAPAAGTPEPVTA